MQYNLAQAAPTAVGSPSAIQAGLNRLRNELDVLHSNLSTLCGRLVPIVRADCPGPTTQPTPKEVPSCEVVEQLSALYDLASQAADTIASLTHRLEV